MSENAENITESKSDYIARTTYMERKEHNEPVVREVVKEVQGESCTKRYKRFESEVFSEQEFLELLENAEKETYIYIAKNPNITKLVAKKILGSVYKAHVNLWNNHCASVDDEIRAGLKEIAKKMPGLYQYSDILK